MRSGLSRPADRSWRPNRIEWQASWNSGDTQQEAIMIPHPTTMMHVVTELRRQDFLTTAEHARQAAPIAGGVRPWRQMAICAITLLALALGLGL
jgi:hypothetical protein